MMHCYGRRGLLLALVVPRAGNFPVKLPDSMFAVACHPR